MAELGTSSLFGDANLVAYYKLENANDGKSSYNLTNQGSTPFNAAKYGNGADLGTSNSTKWLYTTNNLGITGGACSIGGWVKINTEIASSYYVLYRQGSATPAVLNSIFYDYNGGSRRLWFVRTRSGVVDDIAYYTLTMGTINRYHVVYTYDGSNIRGYVNGVLVAGPTSSTGNGIGTGVDGFMIGNVNPSSTGGLQSSSQHDDSFVFSRALTANEVLSLYNEKGGGLFFAQY